MMLACCLPWGSPSCRLFSHGLNRDMGGADLPRPQAAADGAWDGTYRGRSGGGGGRGELRSPCGAGGLAEAVPATGFLEFNSQRSGATVNHTHHHDTGPFYDQGGSFKT
ncbi:hypothetical protein Taro_054517 [Colocasia esculenta]|uniref:Uncharacterized protein n=1 Tax=Colocasia esculenta TaxID=4460 RepID=A0A843XQ96_COLES|nr:hypothetical protein [Colocasia esculenta]